MKVGFRELKLDNSYLTHFPTLLISTHLDVSSLKVIVQNVVAKL